MLMSYLVKVFLFAFFLTALFSRCEQFSNHLNLRIVSGLQMGCSQLGNEADRGRSTCYNFTNLHIFGMRVVVKTFHGCMFFDHLVHAPPYLY